MKNKVIIEKVIDYTHDGKGIIKHEGYPIFVKDCLIDELVEVKIVKWKKKYGFGKLLNVIERSKNRIDADCQFYNRCGGCQLQIMNEEEQQNFKVGKVKNAFSKQAIDLKDINYIKNDSPFNYRNKLSIPLLKKDNVIKAGLYRENSNDIIGIDKCLIQEEIINEILNNIAELLNIHNISIYDKNEFSGYLRQVVIRSSSINEEVLVGFVVNENNYNGELDKVIDELIKDQRIKTVVINFNTSNTNVILGTKNKIISGNGYITDRINDLYFQISLNSFYQVNVNQMDKLYKKAIELANLKDNDIVFDAYCGVGTISSYIAKNVKKVVGVDIVTSAIEDANENKRVNKIENIEFVCADVNEYMDENVNKFNCVFLDPPRKGCTIEFLEKLISINSNKIVYIACDPATQARDVKYLIENGYEINDVCAVDMFSQTYHVETVISLSKMSD